MVKAANANVAASATVNVKEGDAPKVNVKITENKPKNNATRKNNAKNNANAAAKNINAKFNTITKNLKKIKGLRESYKEANEDKKTKIKNDFEKTKADVISAQEAINKSLLEMALEKNVISYFRNSYPDYLQILSNLKIVDDAGEIKKAAEENVNALNQGNLTSLYGNIKNENLGEKGKENVRNIAPPVSQENKDKLEAFLAENNNAKNNTKNNNKGKNNAKNNKKSRKTRKNRKN